MAVDVAAGWLVPLLAGVVSALFAAKVWGHWSVRRRPHQLAWGLGLTFYALATLLDAYAASTGRWEEPAWRAFFALAAMNVGFLGLGTVLLARSGAWGRAFAVFVVGASLVAAFGQLAVPLGGVALSGTAEPIPFPHPARVAFLLLNVLGGLALIGGALLSWRQTRAPGVLLIALGATLPFAGGSLSTLTDLDLRVVLQFLGIAVMFVGYLRGRESMPAPAAPAPSDG